MSTGSPPVIPRSAVSGLAWPALPNRTERAVLALLFQLEGSQWWPAQTLLAAQLRQLQQLIDHSARTVPFYRERLAPVVNLPTGELTLERFGQVPVLGRAEAQAAGEALLSCAAPEDHGRVSAFHTSGSSGRPLQGWRTELAPLINTAVGLRYHLWHRRDLGARNLSIRYLETGADAAPPRSWAPIFPTGPGYVLDMTDPEDVLLERVLQINPDYLQLHPATLDGLIRRARRLGRVPRSLREVRTYGEVVDHDLRSLCREAWGVPLCDNYSAEESGIVALQCPSGGNYHVQSESVLVEVLDPAGRPCPPGGTGRVVVTSLHNFAFPLIRYDLEDLAEVGPPCACGRGLPALANLRGRVRNLVTLPDGRRLHPALHAERIMAAGPIEKYQLVQTSLDEIEVRLVTTRPLERVQEERLSEHFSAALRHDFRYRFVYLEAIPRHGSGKHEVFRSELRPDDAGASRPAEA